MHQEKKNHSGKVFLKIDELPRVVLNIAKRMEMAGGKDLEENEAGS